MEANSTKTSKVSVAGIILVTSCQKYKHTRLKELNLKASYGDWKVICVIGDLFLDCDYKLEKYGVNDGNGYDLLTIKCEDAYIYNLKKYVLSLKYLYEMFDIAEGVLRANDDLVFNESLLEGFLLMPKKLLINPDTVIDIDFLGRSSVGHSLINYPFVCEPHRSGVNPHLVNYYETHQEDFDNPLHNIKGVDVLKYSVMPHIPAFLHGPLIYFSNKSCKILIEHLESIGYNIFHYDEGTGSYPYTIEDCAVSFILYSNKISFIHTLSMYDEYYNNPEKVGVIAIHTNLNKY
jgi:hypothetical protein